MEFNVDGISWKEMARYLAMSSEPWKQKLWGAREMIPDTRFTKGPSPGITGAGPLGKEVEDEEKWIFKDFEPNNGNLRLLLAACLGVAVWTIFNLHTYRFGDKLWQQVSGGPISLRPTAVVAKIRMIRWMKDLKKILKDNDEEDILSGFFNLHGRCKTSDRSDTTRGQVE